MMNLSQTKQTPNGGEKLSRERYLWVVREALAVDEYRFAREAILDWLASFPGDLEAGLVYAQALLGEGHLREALPILSGLCIADPEFLLAAQTWLEAETRIRSDDSSPAFRYPRSKSPGGTGEPIPAHLSLTLRNLQTYVYALTGEQQEGHEIAAWGQELHLARLALEKGELGTARRKVRNALEAEPPVPLAAVTHLHYLERSKANLDARLELAKRYHRIWPDCLASMLYLADWCLEAGDAAMGVALMHQAAARDIGAQAAKRIWKGMNRYHDLWPGQLELALRSAIPSRVAALLGWNQLGDGENRLVEAPVEIQPADGVPRHVADSTTPTSPSVWAPYTPAEAETASALVANAPSGIVAARTESPASDAPNLAKASSAVEERAFSKEPLNVDPRARRLERETLRQDIEDMAARHNLAGITRLDGRFPVYVVFTTRNGLQSTYGRRAAKALEAEMAQLVETIQRRPGWGARLFLADDPVSTTSLGIRPAKPNDPWALKLALADLDAALAAQGEMIGALLIVGDPEAVPFHRLPNPLDDQDEDVPSDNPYATRDKNYFIPEWPVGRLPAGGDPKLLMELLQRIRKQHAGHLKAIPWYRKLFQRFRVLVRSRADKTRASFGYTAAIWRQAAEVVYRPIGNPRVMQVSPPRGVFEGTFLNPVDPLEAQKGLEGGVALPVGRLGYFNLHGLVDAAEWYGQRDPLQGPIGPDYPVALRPEDIEIVANGKGKAVPRLVFSEACYGLHIQGRMVDQAMALKFLQSGSLAVAGSTCLAYGSVEAPLVAADLLGQAFWRAIQDGAPAGEALRQAKITLADEMDRRQGFLDGEDQKTLISFILYGDPLAQVGDGASQSKGVLRLATPLPEVKTICDRLATAPASAKAPADVLASVRDVVSHYLPGMSDADVSVAYPRASCDGEGHTCPTSQLGEAEKVQCKHACPAASGHRLVTLSKMVPRTEGVHAHYARLTLDARGALVKLVVSR